MLKNAGHTSELDIVHNFAEWIVVRPQTLCARCSGQAITKGTQLDSTLRIFLTITVHRAFLFLVKSLTVNPS